MEDIFSTNSSSIIQKQIEISSNIPYVVKSDADLEKFYDIDKIVQWITKNNFNRVCKKIDFFDNKFYYYLLKLVNF